MALYIDFDDCICETNVTLRALALERYGLSSTFEGMTEFDLHISLGLSDTQYPEFMRIFHAEKLLEIPEIPDACATIAAWHRAGLEPLVITGRNPDCHEASRAWLDAHGLADIPLYHLDKYQRFSAHGPDVLSLEQLTAMHFDFAVEDAPVSLALLLQLRLCPIALFDRPWNRKLTLPDPLPQPVRRFTGWKEIAAAAAARLSGPPTR